MRYPQVECYDIITIMLLNVLHKINLFTLFFFKLLNQVETLFLLANVYIKKEWQDTEKLKSSYTTLLE